MYEQYRDLDCYTSTSNWSIKTENDYVEFSLDLPEGTSKGTMYHLLPGITLIYFDMNASMLPEVPKENTSQNLVQFNYCVNGRIEMLLDDNTYLYMSENDYSISKQDAGSASFFPTRLYQGISLYFDMHTLSNSNHPIYESFDLDFSQLDELYFAKKGTYIAEANKEFKTLIEKLWALYETPSTFYIKHYLIELLHLLLEDEHHTEKNITFYTNVQVEIAKKTEKLLTTNLHKHIPIRLLAEQFSVSETSLKNYFRSVYGQNISEYLRSLRMNLASKLLTETDLPISEISIQVGYTKQGKFAAVFKKQFGLAPLEYRRMKHLEGV